MDTKNYMEKYNLVINLETEVKIAMEDLRKELESNGYDTEINLMDVWLDKYGSVGLYSRGEEPTDSKEFDMIQVGHIDNNDLWLY